jgi:Putative transposase
VLAYLSRYTHRVAISNSRLISVDDTGVTFNHLHTALVIEGLAALRIEAVLRWLRDELDDADREAMATRLELPARPHTFWCAPSRPSRCPSEG